MSLFQLDFKMDNEAFCDDDHPGEALAVSREEIKRILDNVKYQLDEGCGSGIINDINGNTIGHWNAYIDEEE
jgi:hypothetical protein